MRFNRPAFEKQFIDAIATLRRCQIDIEITSVGVLIEGYNGLLSAEEASHILTQLAEDEFNAD